jgi:hypothetical protein
MSIHISLLPPNLQQSIRQQIIDGSLEQVAPEEVSKQKAEQPRGDFRDDSDIVDLALISSLIYAGSDSY